MIDKEPPTISPNELLQNGYCFSNFLNENQRVFPRSVFEQYHPSTLPCHRVLVFVHHLFPSCEPATPSGFTSPQGHQTRTPHPCCIIFVKICFIPDNACWKQIFFTIIQTCLWFRLSLVGVGFWWVTVIKKTTKILLFVVVSKQLFETSFSLQQNVMHKTFVARLTPPSGSAIGLWREYLSL